MTSGDRGSDISYRAVQPLAAGRIVSPGAQFGKSASTRVLLS
jgi:hypothetical protein